MSRFAFFCCAIVLAGCGRADVQPADTTPGAGDRAAISPADLAGTWHLRATDEAGGNVVETELTATGETSGWTWTRPDGTVIPVNVVAVEGDSIVMEAGPYESAIRAGVPVQSRMVFRLQGDRLVGSIEARYMLTAGDSVAHRPAQGTRRP